MRNPPTPTYPPTKKHKDGVSETAGWNKDGLEKRWRCSRSFGREKYGEIYNLISRSDRSSGIFYSSHRFRWLKLKPRRWQRKLEPLATLRHRPKKSKGWRSCSPRQLGFPVWYRTKYALLHMSSKHLKGRFEGTFLSLTPRLRYQNFCRALGNIILHFWMRRDRNERMSRCILRFVLALLQI